MAKKVSRRSFLKRALGFFAAMFGISAGGYYYARDIEPRLLEITNYKISDSAIPQAFDNKKIIQFSDTHLGFHYDLKQLEELIEKINSLKPDIVFFTGDLMDEPNKYQKADQIAPLLKKFMHLSAGLLFMGIMTTGAMVQISISPLWKNPALFFY